MKKTTFAKYLVISFFLVFSVFIVSLTSSTALASGNLTTDSDSEPGQTIIKNEDGVMFLTTETNPDGELKVESTSSSRLKRTNSLGTIGLFNFELPTGYATDLGQYINSILRFLMLIVSLIVFYYLIKGGFKWITSGGDKGKLDEARQMIFSAIIGLIIFASSWAILLLLINFLGFSNLNEVFENLQSIDGKSRVTRTENQTNQATSEATSSASPRASSSGILSL